MRLNESDQKAKKIAILLINRQFIRSWIDTGLISKLTDDSQFEVTVFAPQEIYEKIFETENLNIENLGEMSISKTTQHTIAIGLVNNRKLSKTFRWKLRRQFLPQTLMFPKTGNIKFKFLWFKTSLKQLIGNTIDNRITLVYLFKPTQLLIRLYIRILNEKLELPFQIRRFDPDWLIMPSASAHGITNDCIVGARNSGIKTLLAIDNWDHLTGKSTYPTKPDYFTVMGTRCIEHAFTIHGCDQSKILAFGLPRFDIYREIEHSCRSKIANSKFKILYCGITMAHSEKEVIDSIANYFDQKFGPKAVEIHYRPHPGPSPRNDNYEIKNPNVVITKYESLDRTAMPEMNDDFINALQSANVVVGAPTTLMIEAMLLNRPSILDLTTDKFHRTTSGAVAHRYTHILDLIEIDSIPRGENIPELILAIENQMAISSDCAHYPIGHLYDTTRPFYSEQLISMLSAH